jgi:hypothetical protein
LQIGWNKSSDCLRVYEIQQGILKENDLQLGAENLGLADLRQQRRDEIGEKLGRIYSMI